MSRIYLTNLPSDVSGFLLALIDERSPSSTALVTSVTNTSASGDNIAATDTAGGTALKWITKPMLADTIIPAELVFLNTFAKESAAGANAGLGLRLAEYTSSEQAAFLDFNNSVELGTTMILRRLVTTAASVTTIDAGNRLAIHLDVIAVGTMGAGETVTIDYDGPTEGADGDTYIDVPVLIRVSEQQIGSGTSPLPLVAGFGKSFYQRIIDDLTALTDGLAVATNCTVRQVIDECGFKRDSF